MALPEGVSPIASMSRNGCAADAIDRGEASTRWLPVDMDGAGAALPDAAAELRPGHAKHVAHDPKKRNVAVDIHCSVLAVDFDLIGHSKRTIWKLYPSDR